MTLNCEVGIDEAVRAFDRAPGDGTAADLLDSTVEYWRLDFIDDRTAAAHLRKVANYLDAKR